MKYKKPNLLCYQLARFVSWIVATFIFKRKFLRNEIRTAKGPYVVIANHQAALDFANLIGATHHRMSFVISKSFFSTLPIQGLLRKMGVIPKQQFQTAADDLKKMKRVIEAGAPLVIYPAGLMCEDGLSTPIPAATYKFLKWMDVPVYVARTTGTYFVMPKWAKGLRSGRTYMDIYQLFDKEELRRADLATLQEKTDAALLYDAYREQEQLRIKYRKNRRIRGLENVLYQCPRCGTEFSVWAAAEDTLCCKQCGFTRKSDELGFLAPPGDPWRYVSDWSRHIYEKLKEQVIRGEERALCANVRIQTVNPKKHKFVPAGEGVLTVAQGKICLEGELRGEPMHLSIPAGNIPTLPFSPGKYLEIQHGGDIYRCFPENGHTVMKFINLVKIFYTLSHEQT